MVSLKLKYLSQLLMARPNLLFLRYGQQSWRVRTAEKRLTPRRLNLRFLYSKKNGLVLFAAVLCLGTPNKNLKRGLSQRFWALRSRIVVKKETLAFGRLSL